MQHQPIAIKLLMSSEPALSYRKRSKIEFSHLVSMLRTKRKVDVPIEVYPLNTGKYFIADGLHRAKASEMAGMEFIDAILYTDSKPIGLMVPLKEVRI